MLSAIAVLALAMPAVAGPRHGGHGGFHHSDRGHFARGFPGGRHERHEGFRGHNGGFFGFNGGYFGEIIVLDDGCWIWNGYFWRRDFDCD